MMNWKELISSYVDKFRPQVVALSQDIYANPELKFEEYKAARWLADALTKAGFCVKLGVAELDTALIATHPKISDGPTIAILAEYDALPGLGHACGHNLMAGASLGACLALGEIKADLPGKLVFFGTPAEEGGGGKVVMVQAGLFDDIDAAMIFHPSNQTTVTRGSLAITEVEIAFTGKPAHSSSAPEKGINALDAVIQTFNGINALRQHIKDGSRIHGIITNGGSKPNIVPEYAAALFYVRARETDYRDELLEKLHSCAQGAALATGAKLSWSKIGHEYKAMKENHTFSAVFKANLERLGIEVGPPSGGLGSTDMGDVSHVVPAIHPYIAICSEEVVGHSHEFAEAAGSERGYDIMIIAAKALAMTAIDLFIDSDLMRRIKAEHEAQ
ncbi:M20 family metallopeptidase [Candidatus Acetothermia bacterium]|jgi:amidohydrolase|nr:M20 family metallopeptidase [Candidatus Acetothermia bacterium]MCI2427654.1 M20 family metallopeptidase [Candidatus Acetothermia bacterium]MCI2428828.1 M20 family metallopeptidase [Candidatus Acetothermia bacterium]